MINTEFWELVVKKWSKKKEVNTNPPPIKPIVIDDDCDLGDADINDIMGELDDLDDLFD